MKQVKEKRSPGEIAGLGATAISAVSLIFYVFSFTK
jgi:hypothetical protein